MPTKPNQFDPDRYAPKSEVTTPMSTRMVELTTEECELIEAHRREKLLDAARADFIEWAGSDATLEMSMSTAMLLSDGLVRLTPHQVAEFRAHMDRLLS